MVKKPALISTLLGFTVCAFSLQAVVAQQINTRDKDCLKNSVFRKWRRINITSQYLQRDQRIVEVLLDKQSFTKCELKEVFENISRMFTDPETLQIIARLDFDPSGSSEQVRAIYIRDYRNEAFQYKPSSSYKGMKTVIIKGGNPFEEKKAKRQGEL